jgi:predicted  nucleic acid-binding Zn-ribbon protein
MASIVQTTNLLSDQQEREELRKLLAAVLVDLTALRTAVAAIQVDTAELKDHVDKASHDIGLIKTAAGTNIEAIAAVSLTGAASAALTASTPTLTVTD